jgi:hypothetical protein
MVQVRRRQATGEFGFLNEMTFARHIMHVMVFLVIALCFVSYRILLNQDVSQAQLRIRPKTSRTRNTLHI